MIIIDPVSLGDVACARASTKSVFDRTGTLVSVPANTLGVTYDPTDLTKPPYALVEPAATNLIPSSDNFGNGAVWFSGGTVAALSLAPVNSPDGTATAARIQMQANSQFYAVTALPVGVVCSGSVFAKGAPGETITLSAGGMGLVFTFDGTWQRLKVEGVTSISAYLILSTGAAARDFMIWRAQLETGAVATSPIYTANAAATRAADVIAAGAGLVYSNAAITETPYSTATTYAKDALVYDPATYAMYQSLQASNLNKPLTNVSYWSPLNRSINRWMMFDQYNNTQTMSAEEIIVVVSPQAISQGIYLGNLDASEVRISVVDQVEGVVYRSVKNLVVANSGSSFYNWAFKAPQRRTYAVDVALPPYANGLVTIAIKKPGGTPKCGMCAVGPLVDVGLSQYGIGREIKDYSAINFNFDGTSSVLPRAFSKRMDIDVIVDNTQIDFVLEALEQRRQKPLAWLGAKELGSTCLFGRYSSFKSVVESFPESKMNLQIEGTV